MIFFKRTLPLLICFTMGILFTAQYFVPHPWSEDVLTLSNEWLIVIGAFAAFLGYYSVLRVHAIKIKRLVPGWGYSVVVIYALVITFILGIISEGASISPKTGEMTPLGWAYSYVMVPLQGTMFSILAFFIASAAFRAFRVRTVDAFFLLLAALVVMFGRTCLGEWVWYRLMPHGPAGSNITVSAVVDWVMSVPNMAGQRGIIFGVVLGSVAMALRLIFGIERGYLGGGKE